MTPRAPDLLRDAAAPPEFSPRSDGPLSARSLGSCPAEAAAAPRFLRMQVAHDVNTMLEQTLEVHRERASEGAGQQAQLLKALAAEQAKMAEQVACIQQGVLGCEKNILDFGDALQRSHSKILDLLQRHQFLSDDDEGIPCDSEALKASDSHGNSLAVAAASMTKHETPEKDRDRDGDAGDFDDPFSESAEIVDLKRQGLLQRVVTGHVFESLCGSVIVLNAIHTGIMSQLSIVHAIDHIGTGELQQTGLLMNFGYAFASFYTVELLLRLAVYKARYFLNEDWKWNAFDFVLVVAGIYDIIWANVQTGNSIDVKWLRMLRLLKMMKMLRVIRVMHFFQELRVLVSAIQISGKTMLWLIVMLLIILFVFSMCFLQGITAWLNETPSEEVEADHLLTLQNDWGSVSGTMLTLFGSISGGKPWAEVASPLWSAGRLYYYMFLTYITFTLFTVLNVITGIYVDAAMKLASNDYDTVVKERVNTERQNQTRIKEIFKGFDKDKDGSLTYRELETKLLDEKVRAFFQAFEVEPDDAKRIFRMIVGKNMDKAVGSNVFLNGCVKLKGPAKNIDIFCIQADRKLDRELQDAFMQYVEESMEASRDAFRKMGVKQAEVLPIQQRLHNH